MIDIPRLHLRLDIPDPKYHTRRIHIERPLKDTPRPPKLLLLQLPCGIPHPVVHIHPVAADIVFELLAFAALIFMEFFKIGEALSRSLNAGLLSVDGLPEELFGGDLDFGGLLVLNPWRAA